jgi:2-methylisocitrate lyase-like PEP mutase family enzyme
MSAADSANAATAVNGTAGVAATAATADGLRALHQGRTPGDPLVLPGPWDAASARAFAEAGFPALATPSHGVAMSLGYADGDTPADEMFAAIARIARAVDEYGVPVTADIEDGYGLPAKELVGRLADAGAVGCNLEDSTDGALTEPRRQADWLAEVREAADRGLGRGETGSGLFLNARVDSFVRGADNPLADALERARLYVAAGADCVYPIGAPIGDFRAFTAQLAASTASTESAEATDVPVNALCTDGTSPREWGAAGAARVTFGGGLARHALESVRRLARELRDG